MSEASEYGRSRLRGLYEQFRDLRLRISAAEMQALHFNSFPGGDQAEAANLALAMLDEQTAFTEEQYKAMTGRGLV